MFYDSVLFINNKNTHYLENIPDDIATIIFCNIFNYSLPNISNTNVKQIIFESYFNIIFLKSYLPKSLKKMRIHDIGLCNNYQLSLDDLQSIKYNENINLPPTLRKLSVFKNKKNINNKIRIPYGCVFTIFD